MRNLLQTKKRFIIILALLGALDVALISYLMWPGSSPSALQDQRMTLQGRAKALREEVGPLEHMDVKLGQTRTNITALYKDKIPRHSSQISQELEKLTREAGVTAQAKRYDIAKAEKGDLPEIQHVSIETTVTGNYANVARFINSLEQSDLMFIIDQVTLSGQQGGLVSLQIKFETFLKETA